jgi:hypothetical protein
LISRYPAPALKRQLIRDEVAPGVADPGDHPDDHQCPDLLGELESPAGYLQGLRDGERLQQRHFGHAGEMARIDLVDARMGAGEIVVRSGTRADLVAIPVIKPAVVDYGTRSVTALI